MALYLEVPINSFRRSLAKISPMVHMESRPLARTVLLGGNSKGLVQLRIMSTGLSLEQPKVKAPTYGIRSLAEAVSVQGSHYPPEVSS